MEDLALSVVVPTYGRPRAIEQLLARLDRQTLARSRFEVIVVDDGSPEPIEFSRETRYPLTVLRQDNAGPGAARNLAISRARAPLTLILNDDSVPAEDLLEKHVEIHARATPRTAVLGSFSFTENALRDPFVQLLAGSDLLFAFPQLESGKRYDWPFFWTCNLSLPTSALRGEPFDAERFREALVEDVELGYRLQAKGWRVLYREDAHCEHEHVVTPDEYFRRLERLGVHLVRMYRKHDDASVLGALPAPLGPALYASMQATCELYEPSLRKLHAKLNGLALSYRDQTLPTDLISQIVPLIHKLGTVPRYSGMLRELEGHAPLAVLRDGPSAGKLVSIVVVSHQSREQTGRCLEALRRTSDERHPTEIVFVDNGSSDGTPEFLADQADVTLIANSENFGAPRARNQALARARGDWIVFMDNDVVVTSGWLRRLLQHAEVDGKSGCVGPLSDRAAHGQEIAYAGDSSAEQLEPFAADVARRSEGRFRSATTLTSFLVLVRRAVLETIGGFDVRFTPWGFEDDDFTLRAALAGFRNRVALDVFVRHESYAGPKLARHNDLLERNWSRFAEKWAGSREVPYGDYASIEPHLAGPWTAEQLFCSPTALPDEVAPALPAIAALEPTPDRG